MQNTKFKSDFISDTSQLLHKQTHHIIYFIHHLGQFLLSFGGYVSFHSEEEEEEEEDEE